jgi:hypothetical protein
LQHDIDDEQIELGRVRERQTGFGVRRKIDNETGSAQDLV